MAEYTIDEIKQAQLEYVLDNNPHEGEVSHTWIREVKDILTFEESLQDSDYIGWDDESDIFYDPDYAKMVKTALETGQITVYSSKPIEKANFVTPSYMEAKAYCGTDQKPYSKEVNLTDIAWLDPTQGQYCPMNELSIYLDKDIDADLTKEQKSFFRKSVVRDESGNLLEVYHGTTEQKVFDAFDPAKVGRTNGIGHGAGFNFTDSYKMAEHYATHRVVPSTINPVIEMPYGHVYKCYLNITKPLSTDTRTLSDDDIANAFFDAVHKIEDKAGMSYEYEDIEEAYNQALEEISNRPDSEIITILSDEVIDFVMSDFEIWQEYDAAIANDYIDEHYEEIEEEYGEDWDIEDVLGQDFALNHATAIVNDGIQESIGFDGFAGHMWGEGMAYVALSPDQIKATYNLHPTHDKSMTEGFEEPHEPENNRLVELLQSIREDIKTYENNGQDKAAEYLIDALMYAGVHEENGKFMIEDPMGSFINADEYKYPENCIESLNAAKETASKMPDKEKPVQKDKQQDKQQVKTQKKDFGMDR